MPDQPVKSTGIIWQRSSPSGGRLTEVLVHVHSNTQTTTSETLLWAWSYTYTSSCVNISSHGEKGINSLNSHRNISKKFRILHLIVNSEVASSFLGLNGKVTGRPGHCPLKASALSYHDSKDRVHSSGHHTTLNSNLVVYSPHNSSWDAKSKVSPWWYYNKVLLEYRCVH